MFHGRDAHATSGGKGAFALALVRPKIRRRIHSWREPRMSQQVLAYEIDVDGRPHPGLMRAVLVLALPALFEQIFNFLVGVNDTWLANNLPQQAGQDIAPAATAAVGTI